MLRVEVSRRLGDFALDVQFEAPWPALVALFGPSGCGKTSVVNLVAGLLRPDRGRIELDGEPLFDSTAGIHIPAHRRRLGYVFQDSRLFPHLSARANLEYGLKRQRGGAPRIGFDDVVALLGLETLLERRPHALSGGERQRVALGRALLSQPRMLLLDEPLASLDAARRNEVLPYLERLRDQWALPMLYVSHQFEEVRQLATHVVLMERGRVLASAPLQELSADPVLGRIAGEAAVGSVFDVRVLGVDADTGLYRVRVGDGEMQLSADALGTPERVRLQILARDVIVAVSRPEGLSVRNCVAGVVTQLVSESARSDLVSIDVGGITLIARVTHAATRELSLAPGRNVWALVKAVSMRAVPIHSRAVI